MQMFPPNCFKDITLEVVQVTHNDDHTVDVAVKLDQDSLQQALVKASRRLSKNYRIPGFRPGKAPYNVVESMLGRSTLISEVLDDVGDDMYRFGLEDTKIEPYTLGEVKDINTDDDTLTLTFTVAKRPDVELGDYRDIRVDYDPDEISDTQVERGVEIVYNNLALTETVERPAQFNDSVTMTIHGFFQSDENEKEEEDHEHEHEEGEEHDHDHDVHNDDREIYMHEHDFDVTLFEDVNLDSVMPGFSAEIVGLEVGSKKSFSLPFPEDDEDINEELRGKVIDFEVEITKVKSRILPAKDDFVATLASDAQFNTLDELTTQVRDSLVQNAEQSTERKYLNQIIEQLVEGATIAYPQAMLDDYIDQGLEDMNEGLRRQYGLTLDDYLRISGQSKDEVREQRRDQAIEDLKTTLALQAIATEEDLFLDEEALEKAIDKELEQYGELANALRGVLYQGEQRENFGSRLVSDRVTRRLIDIAKGLNPAKGPDQDDSQEESVAEVSAEAGTAVAPAVEDEAESE